jgi:hypothetical protein
MRTGSQRFNSDLRWPQFTNRKLNHFPSLKRRASPMGIDSPSTHRPPRITNINFFRRPRALAVGPRTNTQRIMWLSTRKQRRSTRVIWHLTPRIICKLWAHKRRSCEAMPQRIRSKISGQSEATKRPIYQAFAVRFLGCRITSTMFPKPPIVTR